MDQTITVIIAAYNASATIARAVKSALAELEVAEVIVVDDASADNTAAAAKTVDDGSGRLKILTQPQNMGPSAARNRALREGSAPWVAILDADDFFLSGRMKGLLYFAHDMDFIADDIWQVSEQAIDGPPTSLLGTPLSMPQKINFAEFVRSNVSDPKRQRGELGFIKPLMRREFLTVNQLRYQEHMRLGEDYELYARSLALGARLYLVPPQGYVSVVRENSLSGRHKIEDLMQLRDCDEVLQNTPGLTAEDVVALRQHYLSIDCRLQWRLLIQAVKDRNLRAALATFWRPHPVPLHLLEKLWEQLVQRTGKYLEGHAP